MPFRSDEEERTDQEAEAEFLRNRTGETECFGMVAKVILLILIVAKSLTGAYL